MYRGDSDLGGAGHRLSHALAQPPAPITIAQQTNKTTLVMPLLLPWHHVRCIESGRGHRRRGRAVLFCIVVLSTDFNRSTVHRF